MEKRCFLAGKQDSLFKQLVAGLLIDLADNLKLYECRAVDFDGLLDEVSKIEPHMILLEESSLFSEDSFLVRLLIAKPGLPAIVISENSNTMHIVRRETMLLSSSDDLINAINQMEVQLPARDG